MLNKAMILSAGLGTRLRPLTDHLPKPLVPVAQQSILDHHLARLVAMGIKEVVINLHHLAEAIPRHLSEASWDLKIHYSHEPTILGTGGGLMKARAWLEGEEAFLLLNGDIFHDIDLEGLWETHRASSALATLALRPHPGDEKMGWIGVREKERIERVPEMEGSQSLTRRMFTGLSILTPSIFEVLPPSGFCCVLREGVRHQIEAGALIQGYLDTQSMWVDIGTPAAYLQANLDALVDPLAAPKERIAPNATIATDAQIDETCLIGSHAQIGSKARLDHVVVLPNAQIPPNAQYSYGIVFGDHFLPVSPTEISPPRPLHPTTP